MHMESSKKSACFHKNSTIVKREGDRISVCRMSDLKLDDQVLAYNHREEKIIFDKVIFIHDHGKEEGPRAEKMTVFVNISIENEGEEPRVLQVSENHYVWLKKMGEVKY